MFHNPSQSGPPHLVPVTTVVSQACRLAVSLDRLYFDDEERAADAMTKVAWATIGLTRVRSSPHCHSTQLNKLLNNCFNRMSLLFS